VDLGPTAIAKEWTLSLRRVPATTSLQSLVHDDLPARLSRPPERIRENVAAQLQGFDGSKARPISGA
jgi:hypothetical protein